MGCGTSTGKGFSFRSRLFDPEFYKDATRNFFSKDSKSKKKKNKRKQKDKNRLKIDENMEDYFEAIDMNDGDESASVQAWVAWCFEPPNHEELSTERPGVTYQLEYVYGARMEDSRQNIHINWQGQIVYMSACLGIVMDYKTKAQKIFGGGEINLDDPKSAKHFPGHTEEILCLELDSERKLAASGQVGNKPYVFIWDAVTGEIKSRIKMKAGLNGISCVVFSPEGDRVAWLDCSKQHVVWIYKLRTSKLQWAIETDERNKFDLDWAVDSKGNQVLGVAGIDNMGFITANKGDFSNSFYELGMADKDMTTDYPCMCFDDEGNAYTGTKQGFIFKWQHKKNAYKIIKKERVHIKCVHAIKHRSGKIISGGGDYMIKICNNKFKVLCTLDTDSTVRALDCFNKILVYTTKNGSIIKTDFDIDNLKFQNQETVMKSHFATQECGILFHDDKVYTSGDDNQMMIIDHQKKLIEETHTVGKIKGSGPVLKIGFGGNIGQAANKILDHKQDDVVEDFESDIDINPTLSHIAISFTQGDIVIKALDNPSRVLFYLNDAAKTCECVEYSPNDEKLAVGSHDHVVYIYSWTAEKYDLFRKWEFHSGGIIAIDWDINSEYVRSNWDQNELAFWNTFEEKNLQPETCCDVQWDSHSCRLTWETQGIFPYGSSPDVINCCAYDGKNDIFATGDDHGRVCIYRNPCLPDYNNGRVYRGHAGHIGRVTFSDDGEFMFSMGGYDHTLMQWKRK